MPIVRIDRLERAELRRHPERLFLFGDNEARAGKGGQAAACRGEPNAVGVATKRRPERSDSAYWSDAELGRCIAIIDNDLAPAFTHVRAGGTVVVPAAGLGTGLAELPTRAPQVFAHLQRRLQELEAVGGVAR